LQYLNLPLTLGLSPQASEEEDRDDELAILRARHGRRNCLWSRKWFT